MPASNLSYVIGSRVRAAARMPIGLDAIIEAGEYGTVTEMGEGFVVCVRWDCPHAGLAWVNNETIMERGGVHLTLLPHLRRLPSTPCIVETAALMLKLVE